MLSTKPLVDSCELEALALRLYSPRALQNVAAGLKEITEAPGIFQHQHLVADGNA
jgi:hypothetical protein